ARAAAALRHPRCQRIYALARDADHVYIAYEYVPGQTMRQALRAGKVDDRGAIDVAAQVLDALAHAHGKGIVHRDVKPSNVLLAAAAQLDTSQLGTGVPRPTVDVRLLDFGLAQMAEFDTLTAHGDVPGTLAYVSPERLLGETATAAADVWGVGVMLWEALAGEHPFWAGGASETQRRIHVGAPPLETMRPDLPRALCAVVASALYVNPARRPPASRLAAELRHLPKKRRGAKTGRAGPKAPANARARAGLVIAAGPLLAPVAALALVPLAVQVARGRLRRAAHAAVAVLLAAVAAGLRRAPLPFDGSAPPLGLGITGSDRPGAVAAALLHQLAAHPVLLTEAAALALAAAALPHVRRCGPWPAVAFAAALLAATAFAAPA